MRLFEVLTLILAFTLLLGLALRRSILFRGRTALALAMLVSALAHLLLEKARWQMAPGYGVAAALVIAWQVSLRVPTPAVSRGRRALRVAGAIFGSLLLALSAALSVLMPVIALPKPGGPLAVGSYSFALNTGQPEPYTADPNDTRELAIDVWYPAQLDAKSKLMPMYPGARSFGAELAGMMKMPGFVFNHMELARSHAYANAPAAAGRATYPVLVFSHAYPPGFARQNTVQMEELASRGYVVVSVTHTHVAAFTQFPDGRVITLNQEQLKRMMAESEVSMPIYYKLFGEDPVQDTAEREQLLKEFIEIQPVSNENARIWADDHSAVLDELERIQAGQSASPLSGRLDLERVGLFGMSFGGAAAVETCLSDARCKAVANLDGFQFGQSYTTPLVQPYLMMYSEGNQGMNDFAVDSAQAETYRVVVNGAMHMNYTDFGLFSPLFQQVGFLGSIDPWRMEKILNSYLLAFFDQHLLGKATDFPAMNQQFPEVELRVH